MRSSGGFVGTRGSEIVGLETALFRGLAPNGGLFVPAEPVRLPPGPPPAGDFADVAHWGVPALFPAVRAAVLGRVVDEAFDFPAPLVETEPGILVLELFHGPTAAFKDVGARFLARLASALSPVGTQHTVLVATSGDTGGAVADAFHGVPGFRVVVLFPREGVSPRQRRQMTTLGGDVSALAVEGSFDDCQRLAKEAFDDASLCERHGLMSANSINVGRLLPQALYYVHAAACSGWNDEPVRFIVPCGNLGNLCSGLLAMRMGMPTAGFVAATNANRGFVDFLQGGDVPATPAVRTDSSAMDVGHPSNLERIAWMYGDDRGALARDVTGVAVGDDEARARIRDVHRRTGYVLDPHTAVAYEAAVRRPAPPPTVVLATAHPAKFPDVVEAAIGEAVPLPPALERRGDAEERFRPLSPTLGALRTALEEESP